MKATTTLFRWGPIDGFGQNDRRFSQSEAPTPRQVLDRFISTIESADGAVSIHCDGSHSHAYTLLTAFMLRRRIFASAGEAVAWLHMARSARSARNSPVEIHCALLDAHARRRRSRGFSVCTEADLAPLTRAAGAGLCESAGSAPFPRGPGSPRRGPSARAFSASSPNFVGAADGVCEDIDAGGEPVALPQEEACRE